MTKLSDVYGRLDPKQVKLVTELDFGGITTHELECLVRFYNNSKKQLPEQDSIKLKLILAEVDKRKKCDEIHDYN